MKTAAAIAALLFSGAVQSLISPPENLVWLHPFSWLPAFIVFAHLDGRRALLAGWLVGAAANLSIFYWLAGTVGRFSNVPAPLSLVVLLLFALGIGFYTAVFAWGFGRVRRASGRCWPLALAAWFTAVEFLNPQLFTYYQGVAWYQIPEVFLVTSLTGVSGVTFLVIASNACGLAAFEALRGRPGARAVCLRNTAALGALLVFATAWSAARLGQIERAEAEADTLRIALVQPNYDVMKRRHMRRGPKDVFAADLVELSQAAQERFGPIDVFVWPEGAISREPHAPRNRRLLDFVRESGAEVWTGVNDYRVDGTGRERSYNSAYRVHGDGEVDVRYDKNILVPFGEYMPFADWLPALRNIQGPGDFAGGDGIGVYDAAGARFAFLICYEAIRSAYVRTGVGQRVDLLVNLTFDAWFGDTSEPSQHLMLAAIQSAQYGVPLVRATTTGVSASVDARGIITAQTGVYTREVLVRDVRPVHVPSPYARVGDWFAWSCAAAIAGLAVAARRGRAATA